MDLDFALNLIFLGAVILVVVSMVRFHNNERFEHFNLVDLITDKEGRVSRPALMEVGSWFVATWGFVMLINQGKLTEWYMGAYIGAFVLRAAHAAYLASQQPKEKAP